ncbi:MAG: vWA domain-containing protein [Myxococcota bacterium]
MSAAARGVALVGAWLLAGLLASGPAHAQAAAPVAPALPAPLRIFVQSPEPGEVVRNEVHQAPLRGVAVASAGRPVDFDIMVVLDISGSTRSASGTDVDGDGVVGINPTTSGAPPGTYPARTVSTDPGDAILAAEVRAADALLATLAGQRGSGRIRVGVISFSGEMNPDTGFRKRYDQEDAWLEVPLTNDFGAVRARLPEILARGPYGGTNFAAGLRLAITELAGLQGARSAPRVGTQKLVLFLTDGVPTFPIGLGSESDPGDVQAAVAAARLAERAGVTVNTYALGPKALTNPFAATEIARITGGTFLPVQKPGDIVSFLQAASFADIEDVVFTNLTTREVSYDVSLLPDGRFSGFVPVREGRNAVRVTALASDGTSTHIDVELDFEPSGQGGRSLALELERIRERNKELMLYIERDRIKRFREIQRKQLEIEADTAE